MRVIVQRVNRASVTIESKKKSEIDQGLLILAGFEPADNDEDIAWMTKKLLNLRIFDDENGVMNRSVLDINGEIMIVSQFTLHARTKKGNRPSYVNAAPPDIAVPLYEKFIGTVESESGKKPKTGTFGAHMMVELVNDGPVTIIIDSKRKE
ncbi:MAG: D-tyrosyl-tRNA(Tyr) deacylase [Chlorobi bacterium]|nr:D-tyrosyl-tRNA(Tyr) deacylase [Chlorobiota bacterium]